MAKIWVTRSELRQMIRETCGPVEGKACDECGLLEAECMCCDEVAPPGHEKQVKGIKKAIKRGDLPKKSNPWAIAWSQHDKGKK